MTQLILKRGKFSRSSGQWQVEDYDVLADGKVVGRICSASTPPELRWFWSVTAIVPAVPNRTKRRRSTRLRRSFARHGKKRRRVLKLFFLTENP
jgi:hypothetical protein